MYHHNGSCRIVFSNLIRVQHVQIGYADGTEKSYIYPYLYLDYPVEGDLVMLACSTKPNNEEAVVFKENSKTFHGAGN